MIGQTLGHYRIESKLGAGGMGVVYKALDTHLDRPVAVKVLTAEAVANPERKRRFVQEAKAASALNHPNIITIYDIDQSNGVDFMAMEFVPGKTIEQLIGRTGLRLSEALKYAVQMADALAKAHAAGIVHRDLKPANVMVTDDGLVKVLDFGLAKLIEPEEEGELAATRTVAARTEEGTIIGTVAYMSPEQAEGRKVDARSDIFSFGSVFYEMLSGRRAFDKETKLSTLSAILHQEPEPITQVSAGTPAQAEWLIRQCLRKDAARRLQHMDDVKIALEALWEDSESGQMALAPAATTARRWVIPAVAAGLLLAATIGGVIWWLARPAGRTGGVVLTRLTSDSGLTTDPALSPDGRLVAYASDRSGEGNLDIWVQQLAGGEPVRVTRHEADDHSPSFSPDGARIAFRSEREGGAVYVAPALGGDARLVAEGGRRPRFSPDGRHIAYHVFTGGAAFSRIYTVSATGGAPRRLQSEFSPADMPLWSPDGEHLLFSGARGETTDWWVSPLEAGPATQTGALAALGRQGLSEIAAPGAWTTDSNYLVFSARLGDTTNLWQVPISPQSWKVQGPAERLTTGPGPETDPSTWGGGRLVFANLAGNVDVWALPIDANQAKVTGQPRRLTENQAAEYGASVSADATRLVFLSDRAANWDVWMKDLADGKETAITATPENETLPAIAPDGSKVAYAVGRAIYVVPVRPGGQPGVPKKVCEDCGGAVTHWSSDGKTVLYVTGARGGPAVGLLNVDTGEKTEVLRHKEHRLREMRFSPDQRWLSLVVAPSETQTLLFLAPFRPGSPPPQSEWIEVAHHEAWDGKPRWSPDGNTVYFFSDRDGFRCLWAQRLDPASKKPAGPPFEVYPFHRTRRSLQYVNSALLQMSVTRDRIFFNLGERTGNIWMASLQGNR